jgi:1-deoxy-D-xylulose-5-phosphate synthase
MGLLDDITSPAALRGLTRRQLQSLATEIRTVLVQSVSATGGHLGPNLGVVELTIALHRVFDSPRDALIFDVGHQAYVHKLLTGGRISAACVRAGVCRATRIRSESEHDILENSHASAGLSWADGIAKARRSAR